MARVSLSCLRHKVRDSPNLDKHTVKYCFKRSKIKTYDMATRAAHTQHTKFHKSPTVVTEVVCSGRLPGPVLCVAGVITEPHFALNIVNRYGIYTP